MVGSKNMWKAKIAKGKRLKLDLVRIFEIFTTKYDIVPPRMPNDACDVSFIRDFTFSHRVFGGKVCDVWRRQDGAGYFVSSKGIFVYKYPLIN